MAFPRLTNRMGGRTTQARLKCMGATFIQSTGVGWISQDPSQSGCTPIGDSTGRENSQRVQVLDQSIQSSFFLQIEMKHFPHNGCFDFVNRHFGGIAGMIRVQLISKQWLGPWQQKSSSEFGLTPSTHPIGNQSALIFRHSASNLQKQLVMRIMTERPLQKFELTVAFLPLFHQQHLMNIIPSQTIWRSDHHAVNFPSRYPISQAIQSRPVQVGSADRLISKDIFRRQFPPFLRYIGQQPFQLLFNGLGLSLMLSRYSRIDRYSHKAPPVPPASGFPRGNERFPRSNDRLDPSGLVHPNTLSLPVARSTVASWGPPHLSFSSVEASPDMVAEVRNRNGRRQWFRCSWPVRIKQNLSFVISPLKKPSGI